MNWDELNHLWREQPQSRLAGAQFEMLKMNFSKQSRKMSRKLYWRDVREIIAAVVGIAVFAQAAIKRGAAGWPIWVAIALLVPVAAVFIKERIRAHRGKIGPNASVVDKVDADIAELRHQRDLLRNMAKWYLLPIGLAWFVILASTHFHGLSGALRTPVQMGGYFVGCLVLFFLIWKWNRRAVRKCIEPKIAELEALKHGLGSDC